MATALVSDDIWAQLDPRAGRLSRRGRRAFAATLVALALLVAAAIAVRDSGVIDPRLRLSGNWQGSFDQPRHTFTQTVSVHDDGWHDVHLTGVGAGRRGIRVVGVDDLPKKVVSGAAVTITVQYAVLDCAEPIQAPIAIPLRVSRWWGTATVSLTPPGGANLAGNACSGP